MSGSRVSVKDVPVTGSKRTLPRGRSAWNGAAVDLKPIISRLLGGLLLVLASSALLPAAEPAVSVTEATVGLGGRFKVGFWTPVRLSVKGGEIAFSGRVELVLPDSDDINARFCQASDEVISVPAGGSWTGWRYVKFGKIHDRMTVVLRREDGTVACEQIIERFPPPDPATWQWVVTSGTDVGIDQTAAFLARVRGEKLMSSRLERADQFPDRWYGYEGVDTLVVATGEENPLERLDAAAKEALFQWLRQGGRLLISAGHRAPEVFSEACLLYPLRPGKFEELDVYWKGTGLETYARAAERLVSDETAPLAVHSELRGRAVGFEGAGGTNDRAMITQYSFGFGEITFVALDLDRAPLLHWPARPRLLARLLQTRGDDEDSATSGQSTGQLTHVGYDDISGQLRAALDQYSHVTLVRFSWVAGLLVLYILLVGPVDFLGLSRLRRPHWTWVTFPLIVVAFCLLAFWLTQRWKGQQLAINQIDVVDVDVDLGTVRGTTWTSIYSPRAAHLNLALEARPAVQTVSSPQVLLSWSGLPGSGLGGMNTPARIDSLGDTYTVRYDVPPASTSETLLEGLPIQTSASKGLLARWWSQAEQLEASQLVVTDNGLLSGIVVNPLDVELSNCRVYYENWAYTIDGRLKPGQEVDLEDITPLDLKWQLMRRRVVESHEVTSLWDRTDVTNAPRITEMMMFYGAAGGRAYTGLTHGYLGFLDMSRQLRSGQAVLVGQVSGPATTWTHDQQPWTDKLDKSWTYYRISLPVRSATP